MTNENMKEQILNVIKLTLVVAVLFPVHAIASSATPRTITVQATGEVAAQPDVLVTRFWISHQGMDLAKTKQYVDGLAGKVKKLLQDSNVPDTDYRIMQLSVSPRYDWQRNKKFLGYEVRREIELRLKQIEKFGAILDGVVKSGVNHTGNVQLQLSNQQGLETDAAAVAVRLAKQKAKKLARAAGATLGQVVNIQESGGYVPRPMMRAMAHDAVESAAPVEHVGDSIIRKTVTVTFELN